MRKILFVILSLLCLVVCSCNKEPQDLLTGTWDVSAKIISMSHLINGEDFDPEYCYVFERDGSGRRTRENMVTPFTYQYDGESQSIRFEMEGNQSIWYVDELKGKSFICHSEEDDPVSHAHIMYYWIGTKTGNH